jgi:glycosyltransferase involved in cell wall biosynthesis
MKDIHQYSPPTIPANSALTRGNDALRNGDIDLARRYYTEALDSCDPYLESIVNISLLNLNRREGQHHDKSTPRPSAQLKKLVRPDCLDSYFFILIEKSGLFDSTWYARTYQAIHNFSTSPLEHYILNGVSAATNPSPRFDTKYYLTSNPDVKKSGMHPFLHYLCAGRQEGRLRLPPSSSRESIRMRLITRANGCVEVGQLHLAQHYYKVALQYSDQFQKQIIYRSLAMLARKLPATQADLTGANEEAGFELQKPDDLDPHFFSLIKASGLFDPIWYLQNYQATHKIIGNPLEHYLSRGVATRTNPSVGFDTAFYLESNPDVARSPMHPFLHYLCAGNKEGRLRRKILTNQLALFRVTPPEFVPYSPPASAGVLVNAPCTTVAFYLPQFHAIPENDRWWGLGFTEWTNVRPAKTKFLNHHQPHVPDPFLGYYNLLDKATLRKQISLADDYGIDAFCFYLYWFSGKRLLESPLDLFLSSPELEKSFCVCWANENWTRRWDGSEHEVLMEQEYSPEHDIQFISDISKYLRDPRYLKIGGKPLLIVYRPNLMPDMPATAQRWRQWCLANGLGEIQIAYVQSFDASPPEKYGLDYAIEFPPSGHFTSPELAKVDQLDPAFEGRIFDWRKLLAASEPYLGEQPWVFRGVCPSWDNTARRKNTATIFANSDPALFTRWLRNAYRDTIRRFGNRDERLVFVNAWNEWAEGAHLEPDAQYGYAWLQAVRDATAGSLFEPDVSERLVDRRNQPAPPPVRSATDILFVCHDAEYGGAQNSILSIIRYFQTATGLRVKVLLIRGGPLLRKYEEVADVLILDSYDREEACSITLERKIIAFCNGSPATVYLNTVAAAEFLHVMPPLGVPCLLHVRELNESFARYGGPWQRLIKERVQRYIACSRSVQIYLQAKLGVAESDIDLAYTSLTRDRISQIAAAKAELSGLLENPETRPVVVLGMGVGMPYRKGADLFIDVFKAVCRRSTLPFIFRWVGDFYGQELDEAGIPWTNYLAEVSKLSHQGLSRIEFVGYQEEVDSFLAEADIFLLTSREEPFARTALEASVAGLPVVAFKGSGGADELLSEFPRLLVPEFSADKMASRLIELADDPGQRKFVGDLLCESVKRTYNTATQFPKLISAVRRVIRSAPAVSIIVPNFNYGRLLEQRISSILEQKFQDFEIIILDDASTDDSRKIIDSVQRRDDRIRTHYNLVNSGSPYPQWLKGIEMARGELIWVAEADDLSEPNFLSEMVRFFDYPDVRFAYCASIAIDSEGRPLGDYRDMTYLKALSDARWRDSYIADSSEEVCAALGIKNVVLNISSAVFRKFRLDETLAEEIKEMTLAGDWLFILEAVKGGSVGYSARAMNKHRRHADSAIQAELKGDYLGRLFKTRRRVHEHVERNFHVDHTYHQRVDSHILSLAYEHAASSPLSVIETEYFFSEPQKYLDFLTRTGLAHVKPT